MTSPTQLVSVQESSGVNRNNSWKLSKQKESLTCKYVIARRRSPCEIELRVERACNRYYILCNVDIV